MAAQPRLVARFRTAARVAGGIGSGVGLLVCLGWTLATPALAQLLAGRFSLEITTGIALILTGAALWLQPRAAATWCAIAVVVGGVVVVAEHMRGGASIPGRMEADTAVAFVLVGAALLLREIATPAAARASEALALGGLTVAFVGLFRHSFNGSGLFGIGAYVRMTLAGAVTFVILALGALFAEPERGLMASVVSDSAGGVLARRLYPAAVAIPVVLGQLTLLGERHHLFGGRFGLGLCALASVAGFALVAVRTDRALDRSDSERLRRATVLLEEAERRHLARELHDEVGQSLTALKLRLQVAEPSEQVLQARGLVAELMTRVSRLSLDLRPAMLDDFGLLPALIWLFERYTAQTDVQVHFAHSGLEGRLAPIVETAAFRIVQEALTNVARHAAVPAVDVRVWRVDGLLSVQIADEGRGFDAPAVLAACRSSGLSGMRERAAALGGALTIESGGSGDSGDAAQSHGTRLTAELPLPRGAGSPKMGQS